MGLFSKKRRTTVENFNNKVTLSRIVKFSYLQTLAIDGGLTSIKEAAGETEAREDTVSGTDINRNEFSRIGNNTAGDILDAIFMVSDLPPGLGDLASSLFGKKITRDVKINTKESGWTLTKTWNQPQFDIVRYGIGIKDLTVSQFTYEEVSELVSTPWTSPKEIVKVVLNVDQFIPNIFPAGNYISYYIKANVEGSDWIQINPIGLPSVFKEDGSIVPRIINFNTEQPISSRLEDGYFITSAPVKEIIFRAVFTRPSSLEGTTADASGYSPVLKSYRMLMTPKESL